MNLADILNTNPQEQTTNKIPANIFARNIIAGKSAARKEKLTDYLTKHPSFNCSQIFSMINYSEYQKTLE